MIHNISIATDDDIIQLGDDVNIPCIFIQGHYYLWKLSEWLEKTIVSDHIFCQFLVS